ncbi:hypothetical protein CMK11_07395 [Candidatus Poribacteria bacterium]|nr:hypothetical protein [Candidatus Poribacteria bacterium]
MNGSDHMAGKFLGMVMTPLDVQVEGLDAVMDRIAATGATAISTGRAVAREAASGAGHRAPPLDIDGYARVFDRPVWGKRELMLESFTVDRPNMAMYDSTPYKPGWRDLPPGIDAETPDRIVEDARRRGWEVYVGASPLAVPGPAPDDQMRWPDGSAPDPARRVARQGCPSAPDVRAYAVARVLDTVRAAAPVDGVCLDWLEYTTYLLEDHFACVGPHSLRHAEELGYDAGRIARDVTALWDWLHRLDGAALEHAVAVSAGPSRLVDLLLRHPGWHDFLSFKRDVVRGLYAEIRSALDEHGYGDVKLVANGWAPPFNRSSGMDYAALSTTVQVVRPKMYTFHWSAMPRWYGETLLNWNPDLGEGAVIKAVKRCFDLPDDNDTPTLADYHIPGPDEEHPVHARTFRDRVQEVARQVDGRCPVMPLAHGYRPAAQWKRKLAILRDCDIEGLWVQRYCYLSDEKLGILGDVWR